MAPAASPERPAEMNLYVIFTFNIGEEGFNGVSSIKTDIYFTLGFVWLAASSNLRYIVDASAGRMDRHFKTNHRLAYPSCPHVDQQIQRTASSFYRYA